MSAEQTQLEAVLPALRCTICAGGLELVDRHARCERGHAFDIAKQGYLNLAVGRPASTADTAQMVGARAAFLGRGHYGEIAAAIGRLVVPIDVPGLVVDVAGGTGHYLAAALDLAPARLGICLDLSAPALRRAARVHARAAAVGADTWRRLPLADGSAAVALSIFGPRDPAEIRRVLAPGGRVVTVSPTPAHLRELVEPLGLIAVDPQKDERRAADFAGFEVVLEQQLEYELSLSTVDVVNVAAMGPSAWHVTRDTLEARAARLPDPVPTTVSVRVTCYRPR